MTATIVQTTAKQVSDEVVLSAKNVTVKGQIENLNLDLHKGEILGIGGLSECGMHEVGKGTLRSFLLSAREV